MQVYPDNKPQKFRTLLPTPLNLEGEWEVGLSTMIYPHNWYNIKSESTFKINVPLKRTDSSTYLMTPVYVTFKGRQFADIDALLKELNEQMNSSIETKVLTMQNINTAVNNKVYMYKYIELAKSASLPQKVSMLKYRDIASLKINLPDVNDPSRALWRVLGFDDSDIDIDDQTSAKYPASLTLHSPALYVYTPMIEYVGVGDTHAPLFAVVPIRGNMGDIVYERFEKPIYMRLNQKYIAEIEIGIKEDTGADVEFVAGKTILILHFRRRS